MKKLHKEGDILAENYETTQEEEALEERTASEEKEEEQTAEADPASEKKADDKEAAGSEDEKISESDTPEDEPLGDEGSGDDKEQPEKEGESKDPRLKSFFKKKSKKNKFEEQVESLTDRLKRQMAEFENFRKRSEKEKSQMYDMGAKSMIERILPVADSFERGLGGLNEEEDNPFADGMRMVYKQLMTALDEAGVKEIEAVGKTFDPDLHNAVMHIDDDSYGENEIVEELQKGYTYHDSVVRYAMVKVAN